LADEGAPKAPRLTPFVCEPSHTPSCQNAVGVGSYPQGPMVPRQPGRRGACFRPWGGARRPWTYAVRARTRAAGSPR
jgi:hypothetical protein